MWRYTVASVELLFVSTSNSFIPTITCQNKNNPEKIVLGSP